MKRFYYELFSYDDRYRGKVFERGNNEHAAVTDATVTVMYIKVYFLNKY